MATVTGLRHPYALSLSLSYALLCQSTSVGVSENVVYPIVPNGFADHYPYEKWLAIIGNKPNIFRQTQYQQAPGPA